MTKTADTVRRVRHAAKDFLGDIDVPEAVLFGTAGYFVGPVLDATGIGGVLHDKFPSTIGRMGDQMWQQSGGTKGTGEAISKATGLGLLAYEANEARQHKLSRAEKSSTLPLALGMLIDGPEGTGKTPSSSGASWGGAWG